MGATERQFGSELLGDFEPANEDTLANLGLAGTEGAIAHIARNHTALTWVILESNSDGLEVIAHALSIGGMFGGGKKEHEWAERMASVPGATRTPWPKVRNRGMKLI